MALVRVHWVGNSTAGRWGLGLGMQSPICSREGPTRPPARPCRKSSLLTLCLYSVYSPHPQTSGPQTVSEKLCIVWQDLIVNKQSHHVTLAIAIR